MKKIISLIFAVFCTILLVSCDFGSSSGNDNTSDTGTKEKPAPVVTDAYENHKKILSLVEEYSVVGTNGYDYSVEQKYKGSVTNAHTIALRLDGDKGSRTEYTKTLNEDISLGLYTEKQAVSYYREGEIATFDGNNWEWKENSFDNFASVKINNFSFDINSLKNIELEKVGQNAVLTFSVDDSKASAFLGSPKTIRDLKFEIKTSTDYTSLVSFALSYAQENTTTEFCFMPYTSVVEEIAFPQK